MGVWYCTREDVKSALDSKLTARDDRQVDRAIEAGARLVEGCLHRPTIAPTLATRFFDWPNDQYARPWRLWLDANTLISVTTLTSGGVAIPASDFFLEPANEGPPFTHIELDLDSNAAFGGGDTHQRDIGITGLWGYRDVEDPAGALAEDLDSSEFDVDVTDGAPIGVGSIVRCESERMIVTGRQMLDTTVNLGGDGLLALDSDTLLEANVGSIGEVLLIDAERLLVVDVVGTNRVVKRAWDGSVLAAHTPPADVFASRRLTVKRGQLGTSAAAHTNATALSVWVPPAAGRALQIAEAINIVQQEQSAYSRTIGSGESERESYGRGLREMREYAYTELGRKARSRAI